MCIGLVYYSLACQLSHYHSFWSPDSGARFALVQNWIVHGSIYFAADDLSRADPKALFHPLGDYVVVFPKGNTSVYSPFFPLLASLGYRLAGTAGLAVPAVIGGMGTLLFSYLAAGRLEIRRRGLLLLVMGLATPLLLYSVVFWDHSLQMMLVAAAGYCLTRGLEVRPNGWVLGAGVLLGIGIWFQELFVVLLVALLVTAPIQLGRSQGGRVAGYLLAGFLPVIGAWIAVNLALYGVPGGPHTQGPNQVLHPYHLKQLLDPGAFLVRAQVQLVGNGAGPLPAGIFAGLVLLYVVSVRTPYRMHPARAVLLGGLAAFGALLMLQADWSHGLLETTPLLIPALVPVATDAPLARPGGAAAAKWFHWLQATTVVFGFLVILNPLTPGMDWGSRYLLTVLPVLACISAYNVERISQCLPSHSTAWPLALGVLVLASSISQWRGWKAIVADLIFSRHTARIVREFPSETLVSDVWWLGPELTLASDGKRHLYYRPTASGEQFAQVARILGFREFCYLGSAEGLERISRESSHTSQPFRVARIWMEGGWSAALFTQK